MVASGLCLVHKNLWRTKVLKLREILGLNLDLIYRIWGLDHGGFNKNLPRMMADSLSKVPYIMDNFFKLSFH